MTRRRGFWRCYGEADWIAHLVLTTCFAAALNFVEVFSNAMAAAQAAGTHVVDGYEITVCYFGPPASFYPRLIALGGLLIATTAAFKRTFLARSACGFGLVISLGIYIYWWLYSYRSFLNFEDARIRFVSGTEIHQSAYLYNGTFLDLGVALSLIICLVSVLDRLLDGEKELSRV
jgi:hypothetical protein